MEIDFIFDATCPWSYIGKHRLQQAIAARPEAAVRINWIPFLLNPELPVGGVSRHSYLAEKFGSEARIKNMHRALTEAGKSSSVVFNFDRIVNTPNTMTAHRFIQMACVAKKGSEAVEQIFYGYFTEGSDISDLRVLSAIAEKIGLDGDDIRRDLKTDRFKEFVYRENARAHRLGINGVPSFACNATMIISGAQDAKALTRVIDAAIAELKFSRAQASYC